MKNSRSIQIQPLIVNTGSSLVYVAICIGIILYSKNHSSAFHSNSQDWAKVLLATLSNSVTIILGLADIVIAAILLWQKKEISKRSIALFTITFFVFVCFNSFALHYPLSSYAIVLVDGILFVFCASYSFLWGSKVPTSYNSKKSRVLGKINHKHIIAEQLFSFKRTEKGKFVLYTVTSDEHILNSEHDINGILSVTYQLPHEDDTTFTIVRNSYHSLLNDGNENTRTELIKLLHQEKDKLTNQLKTISSVDDVSTDDCCLARVLMIYLAFLRILDPPPENPGNPGGKRDVGWYGSESYIGELSLEEGNIGLNIDIEQKLFTLLRTGLLGAILVGSDSRYIFSYKKSGYKTGRRYSATVLSDAEDATRNKLCLFTLSEIHKNSIPPYIISGIINEENLVVNKLKERG